MSCYVALGAVPHLECDPLEGESMSKLVFAAVLMAACYTAYRAILRAAERQRDSMVRARAQSRVEPRDLGTLREVEDGLYVPDNHR